ncbi:aspartic peptidase domain-containing protein [Mycena latifolia]|nr:aspartic peptidase domain-containing protein [Mycena latifolia]
MRILALLGDTAGQPFLFNVLDQNPDQDNFMAISFSRKDDLEGSVDAPFTINELEEPSVPLFPGDNVRWNILVDAINVNGNFIPLTCNVPNAPNGSLVALMDTGTSTGTLPPDILYAVYSHIPGASVTVQGNGELILFIVPCNTSAIITVVIGGVPYTIHPLDLSDILTPVDDGSGTNFTLCSDSFMRNIYSVFDFGDNIAKSPTGAATMQLLSQTTPREAVADMLNVRMRQLANAAPEFQGTFPGFIPAPPVPPARPPLRDASALSDGTALDFRLRQYGLIIIGHLSGNLLVVLILADIGLALYIKRNGTGGASSRSGAYIPVKLRKEAPRRSEGLDEDHRYLE